MHGLQSNKSLFNDLFKLKSLKKYSIIACDFIGYGESSKPRDFSYSLEDQAHIIKSVISQMGISKMHLVGHSLGGMVSMLILNENIKSFVNLEGNFVFNDCGKSAEVTKFSFKQFKEEMYPNMISEMQKSKQKAERIRSKWIQKTPDYVFYKTSVSIVELSRRNFLLNNFINFPNRKIYVYGSENSNKLEIIPKDIETVRIENSGHFTIVEQPEETIYMVASFIESNQQAIQSHGIEPNLNF